MALDTYEYANWYPSGWVGGFPIPQGYDTPVPAISKDDRSAYEWGYGFVDKRAESDITNPFGEVPAKTAEPCDDGSSYDRPPAI